MAKRTNTCWLFRSKTSRLCHFCNIFLFASYTLFLALTGCVNEESTKLEKQYLFLGHPYDWAVENRIDPRLELLDFSQFDGVWLGGDVCSRSSKDPATLRYLDSIFDLDSPNTHWALGNHDLLDGDENRISAFTKKPTYYYYQDGKLGLLVLNTNLFWHQNWNPPAENCESKSEQLKFLQHFADTIKHISTLVILHHHGIFNELKASNSHESEQILDNISAIPVRPDCRPDGNLLKEWYPKLVGVHRRGLEVILIAGDVGMNSKGYHIQTPEGIHLLGSGINNSLDMNYIPDYVTNTRPDSILILNYAVEAEKLSWQFLPLSKLVLDHLNRPTRQNLSPRVQELLSKY